MYIHTNIICMPREQRHIYDRIIVYIMYRMFQKSQKPIKCFKICNPYRILKENMVWFNIVAIPIDFHIFIFQRYFQAEHYPSKSISSIRIYILRIYIYMIKTSIKYAIVSNLLLFYFFLITLEVFWVKITLEDGICIILPDTRTHLNIHTIIF